MNNNLNNWKEFHFSEIFVIRKGFYNKKPEHTVKGKIPFLGATDKNNGVTEYYSIIDIESSSKNGDDKNSKLSEKIFPPHALCVTNNGSVGYAYYQNTEFTCSHDVNPLYIKDGQFTEASALFVATVIGKDRYRWAYGRKWRPERMEKSSIMLPATIDGKPDWEYMEKYIHSLNFNKITTKNTKNKCHEINTNSWKEYKVKDIFDIYNGKGITTDELDYYPGEFTVVQSGSENNGVLGYIDLKYCINKGYTFTKEMCLTVARSGSAGYISFQKNGCVVGDSAKILKLKEKEHANIYSYLFLKAILMANKYKYTYGRKVTKDKYLELVIKLPIKDNRIDWAFMENYIKSLPYGDLL